MKKKSLLLFLLVFVLVTVVVAACGKDKTPVSGPSDEKSPDAGETGTEEKEASGNLVIYTARDESVVEQVVGMFNDKYPDVQVDVLTMGAQQILERTRGEKANPQADFWWGGTQSALMVAANEDLLESYKPSFDASIAADHKDAEGRWYGEMLLPEVIMINSDVLTKETGPQDWDELLDAEWKDKIIIRGVLASGTMRTIYSSMIYRQDATSPDKGYAWLEKLNANTKDYAQDPTNLYLKLARQEGTVSLWNLQDILLQKELNNQPFDYIYPTSGAPILVDGVAMIKGSKNQDNAKLFYEFLFDKEVRVTLAEDLFQIPTRTDISAGDMPAWYKDLDLKPLDMDWTLLAEKEAEWMQYWDERIKSN
ncbi:extracellular solute-binding protein [Sporosarcina sp. NPDC096371]|uniref:extracellular solute-binding protein n=1 Tax=Sporosarcina sp. NPDC096371 TaxID=3364530 RepID=UPI00380F562B